MMPRSTVFLLALATLSAPAATLLAQNAYLAGSGTPSSSNPSYVQSQAAPIERATPDGNNYAPNNGYAPGNDVPMPPRRQRPQVINSQPEQGVLLRYERRSSVETVSASPARTEIRVNKGIANVDVYNPVDKKGLILVDLPGGQTQLLKNGLYTFNAQTNTVRVLHGEADAFPAGAPGRKPVKVKEDHEVSFTGPNLRSTSFDLYQADADLLPIPQSAITAGQEAGYGPYPGYAYGPYGDGFYGYPYGYYGYPYFAWGYPFWGYGPFGFGLGFGYYGGYYGGHPGGFHPVRGGYAGGFHNSASFHGSAGFSGGGGFHGGGGGGGRR